MEEKDHLLKQLSHEQNARLLQEQIHQEQTKFHQTYKEDPSRAEGSNVRMLLPFTPFLLKSSLSCIKYISTKFSTYKCSFFELKFSPDHQFCHFP